METWAVSPMPGPQVTKLETFLLKAWSGPVAETLHLGQAWNLWATGVPSTIEAKWKLEPGGQWREGFFPAGLTIPLALLLLQFSGAQAPAPGLKGQLFLAPGEEEFRLLVKFRETAGPDLAEDGGLILRNPWDGGPGIATELRFRRAIAFTPGELAQLKTPALRKSAPGGFDILGFSGLMYLEAAGSDKHSLLALAQKLEARGDVEYCELEPANPPPPPGDLAPTTPDYTARQTYLGPNPGIDCKYAWSLGIKGQGVRLSDVEFDWNFDHEDLMDQDLDFGMPKKASQYSNHGTAVMGIMASGHNGYGMDGCAPQITGRAYSELHGRAAAIARAAADSRPGDVILLEMQTSGPDGKLAPADVNVSVWDAVKKATDAGVIVVAAAGNGGADLDGSAYAAYRARGDNGSIIEGAGSNTTAHSKLGFSTFGARVNVQGWGTGVASLDYGGIKAGGSDVNQFYTTTFSGTSSAGPIVTSAVMLLQSFAKQKLNKTLTPKEMREVLVATGVPQGSGGHIGPLPDIKAAIQKLGGPVHALPPARAALATIGEDGFLTLDFAGRDRLEVRITDAAGRTLYSEILRSAREGRARRIALPIAGRGLLYLHVSGEGFSEIRRLARL